MWRLSMSAVLQIYTVLRGHRSHPIDRNEKESSADIYNITETETFALNGDEESRPSDNML